VEWTTHRLLHAISQSNSAYSTPYPRFQIVHGRVHRGSYVDGVYWSTQLLHRRIWCIMAQDTRAKIILSPPARSLIRERIPLKQSSWIFAKDTFGSWRDFCIMRSWYGRGRSLQAAVTACCLVAFILYVWSLTLAWDIVLTFLHSFYCPLSLPYLWRTERGILSGHLYRFGYDQGVFSGIVGNEDWRKQFGYPNDSEEGIIVSCYNLGCLLGCLSMLTLYTRLWIFTNFAV